jgi:hypothetical protein
MLLVKTVAGGPGRTLRWVLLLALAALLLPADGAWARVLRVGPDEALKVPSEAARIAADGDTVEIVAGDYTADVASWRQNRLTLRGVGGRPHLRAAGRAAEGKAIWVIKGDEVLVENVEMSGTRVPGFAGAAIRAEGGKLTLRNVHFHDHQMGILTNNNGRGELAIIDSEFDHNIVDYERYGKLGHNIYVGQIASFELRGSYVHDAVIGHQVKTRARRTPSSATASSMATAAPAISSTSPRAARPPSATTCCARASAPTTTPRSPLHRRPTARRRACSSSPATASRRRAGSRPFSYATSPPRWRRCSATTCCAAM